MLRAQRPEKDFIITSILILLQKEVFMWFLSLFGARDIALAAAAAAAKSLQSCPTLCDPIDGSPPGSFRGIFQARALERGAIAFSSVPQKVHVLQKLCIWSYLEIELLEI